MNWLSVLHLNGFWLPSVQPGHRKWSFWGQVWNVAEEGVINADPVMIAKGVGRRYHEYHFNKDLFADVPFFIVVVIVAIRKKQQLFSVSGWYFLFRVHRLRLCQRRLTFGDFSWIRSQTIIWHLHLVSLLHWIFEVMIVWIYIYSQLNQGHQISSNHLIVWTSL